MIRAAIQSALCLCLSPMLAAQRMSQGTGQTPTERRADGSASNEVRTFVTMPKNTEIDLILLEPVSSATAKLGSSVPFSVALNVVANGLVVIPAGTPVVGTVTKVRRCSPETRRNGRLTIRVGEVAVGEKIKFPLKSKPAELRVTPAYFLANLIPEIVMTTMDAVSSVSHRMRVRDKPLGLDPEMSRCSLAFLYLAKSETVRITELAASDGASKSRMESACPDGERSGALNRGWIDIE